MTNRTKKIEVRVSPEEKSYIQQAAENKDMTVSDFVRFVAVEMARAIAMNKTPEDTYHAVLMGVGRISPEVVLYSATADMSDYKTIDEENDEGET